MDPKYQRVTRIYLNSIPRLNSSYFQRNPVALYQVDISENIRCNLIVTGKCIWTNISIGRHFKIILQHECFQGNLGILELHRVMWTDFCWAPGVISNYFQRNLVAPYVWIIVTYMWMDHKSEPNTFLKALCTFEMNHNNTFTFLCNVTWESYPQRKGIAAQQLILFYKLNVFFVDMRLGNKTLFLNPEITKQLID